MKMTSMLVQLPLHLDTLPGMPTPADLLAALAKHYAGSGRVSVEPATDDGKIEPQALNDTNKMELRVYSNMDHHHAVPVGRLDNLGKGASGRGGGEPQADARDTGPAPHRAASARQLRAQIGQFGAHGP